MLRSPDCAFVLLAGGASSRMGSRKQLLPIGGKTMLRHVIDSTMAAPVSPYVVVLGADAELIRPNMDGAPVHTVVNVDWREGIASSIRTGIWTVLELAPRIAGVVIALADQPGLDARKIAGLIQARDRAKRGIASASFDGMLLPPVYFAAKYFRELMGLKGDEGAKAVIKAHSEDVHPVPMDGLWDLDTREDYAVFLKGRT